MNHNRSVRPALVEEELISSVAWFIRFRWAAGVGVLAAVGFTTSVLRITLPAATLYALGFAILAYNAVFRVILDRLLRAERRDIRQFDWLIIAQIGMDWLAMAALVHFTGGLESPAILYFFFHLIIVAILLSPRATYFAAAMAAILVGAITALEYVGALAHVGVPQYIIADQYRVPTYILGKLFFLYSTMFASAYLASTLSSRLRQREAQVVELSDNLQRAYARLRTLYESAEAVSSTLELNEVLDQLVRHATDALGVRACSIRLLDESGARLHVAAVYGLSEAYVQKGDLLIDRNPLAREVLAGKTIITNDVTAETGLQYPTEALAEGICSMLSAPLHGNKKLLGLIRAYSVERNHFTQDDVEFLEVIASQGSVAIENAMAYQELSQLDEMKSKFALTVTHELRSPVSVVRSLLRTMTGGYAGALSEEQRDLTARALRRADFLQTLIDDLLDLAAGKSDLAARAERVVVHLDEVIPRVVQRFEPSAREKRVQLQWCCEACHHPITISATNEGIDRIVNNLVSNAVKYTPAGGRVSVSLRLSDANAVLQVEDTGIGIPEDSLPHLFEEFYRAPNAKAQEKEGTGLGLAITRDLVTRYNGHISVQSQPEQGTRFTVMFPVVVELSV